jgi:hypothetical protein
MASYTAGSVYIISSSAAQAPVNLPHVKSIWAVKFFSGVSSTAAALSSTAAILEGGGNSTGAQMWFDNRTGGPYVDLLNMYQADGITVSVTGGASVWIYGQCHV